MSKMKKDMLVAVALVMLIIGGVLYFAIRRPISPVPSLEPTAIVTSTPKIEDTEEAMVEIEDEKSIETEIYKIAIK